MASIEETGGGEARFCPGCRARVGQDVTRCPHCKYSRPKTGWPTDPFVGRLVGGKYRLKSRLGSGGFALIFLARQMEGDIDLGEVVLKFLHESMAGHESVRRRFINEARAARKVGSPHAVKVFDLGFDEDDTPYMVMEHLRGDSLDRVLSREKKLSPHRAFRIGLQVASALEECHSVEIIHRDLKPDNLILLEGRREDFVKVLDFGIARVPSADGSVTHTLMGTPRYMPPEQILQTEIDGGVDIFALGVILYECLTGRPPITAATPMEYLQRNVDHSPTPLRELCLDMPADVETLLESLMAKDRALRPASMADVEQRLRSLGQAHGWVPRDTGEIGAPAVSRATQALGSRKQDAGKGEDTPEAAGGEAASDRERAGTDPSLAADISTSDTIAAPGIRDTGDGDDIAKEVEPESSSGEEEGVDKAPTDSDTSIVTPSQETLQAQRALTAGSPARRTMVAIVVVAAIAAVVGVIAFTRSSQGGDPQQTTGAKPEKSTAPVTVPAAVSVPVPERAGAGTPGPPGSPATVSATDAAIPPGARPAAPVASETARRPSRRRRSSRSGKRPRKTPPAKKAGEYDDEKTVVPGL